MPKTLKPRRKTDRDLRKKRLAASAQLRQLMDVAEAARLSMGCTDEISPSPKLMIENLSEQRTAEDAWRADHFALQNARRARKAAKPDARPTSGLQDWTPAGLLQLLGGRAVA